MVHDVDTGQAVFTPQSNVAGSNGYGSFSIDAAGAWTYTMGSAHDEFVAGTDYTDSITVSSVDGTASQLITVTIHGSNDAAVISGTSSGSVTEAGASNGGGTPTASGTLIDTDVDNAPNSFTAVVAGAATANGYGTFAITAGGLWTYTLNNANPLVNALNVGGTLSDSFTVTSADGTQQIVSVMINGANDAAVISGTSSGSVTEDAVPNTVIGDLNSTDVDGTGDAWTAVATATASANNYGIYTIDATGHWSYALNNANPTVNALNNGQLLGDSFTVATADGTPTTVAITITGHTDVTAIILPNTYAGIDPNDFDNLGLPAGTTIVGGNGADTLYGGAGVDTISGGNGSDTIYAGSGGDSVNGGTQGDTLFGGSGNDTIIGDEQNDILIGGYGADTLTGGNGADTFKYLSALDTNDTIMDFTHGTDKFDFSQFDWNSSLAGTQQLAYGGTNATAHGIWSQTTGGITTIYADTDGNLGTAEFMVTLSGSVSLDSTDFLGLTNPLGLP